MFETVISIVSFNASLETEMSLETFKRIVSRDISVSRDEMVFITNLKKFKPCG